ncbi:DNA-directed RNA polymerase sigma-70 factor [Bryobacterales bacterium F-183]|nr:DNA-directed RNA polymerase sigma-70 factor [Bryobacterales bacterium F-183]
MSQLLSFETLYRDHASRVFRYALALCGDEARARDIVSETFLRAWAAPTPLRVETVRAYLCAIARNLYLAELRNTRRLVPIQAAGEVVALTEEADNLAERRQLREAVGKLPEGLRSALSLVVWEELSLAEAAQVLGISVSAMKMRVARAKLELAKQIKQRESWR